MASFVALYSQPADAEGFDRHYREVHNPLLDNVEGIREVRLARGTGTPRGTEPPYHLVAEIVFTDGAALQAALASDAFREVGKDAMAMCQQFGSQATMLLTETFE